MSDRKRGGRLHKLLKRYRKRKQRFNHREYPSGSIIPNRVSIDDRPAIVAKRKRLGDLEGDLIRGYRHSGFILSVVDRKSKYLVLRKLKTKRKNTVSKGLQTSIKRWENPNTLTVDNGSEFCDHQVLTQQTGVPVYFTRPYCSTERGTIENSNGLVRHFFPKKTSFAKLTQRQLNKIQTLLNRRPRKCLNFLTPEEVHLKNSKSPPKRSLHL